MKVVYDLRSDLAKDPERIRQAQAMTLNTERPLLGLKGKHGLFASKEWWSNIETGTITRKIVIGTIEELSFAGQDSRWGDQVNSFVLRLQDGSLINESIYVNRRNDQKLFQVGALVRITYALDELKKQPSSNGGVNCASIVLEVALSQAPANG